jgi:TetR/AcrR family transcriptional repressor of nem operon
MAVNTAAVVVARTDEVATDLVRCVFERNESAFRAVIEEGQRSGEISPGRDSAGLAAMLQNTVMGCGSRCASPMMRIGRPASSTR